MIHGFGDSVLLAGPAAASVAGETAMQRGAAGRGLVGGGATGLGGSGSLDGDDSSVHNMGVGDRYSPVAPLLWQMVAQQTGQIWSAG